MRSYLSQIVSRAAGTTEAAAIKPNIQSWPVKKNVENRLNPFEEGGDFTEPATPTSSIESTISPLGKTMSFKKEQYPKNDFPAINHNNHAMEKSDIPKSDRIFPVQQKNLTSLSPETNVSLKSSIIKSNALRTEKPLYEKSLEVKKQVIEKSEKIIEEIHTSEILESVKPVSIEPNNKHEKTPALKETTSKKKEKIREPYQSADKPIQPKILFKKDVKPATSESKKNIKPHKKNDRMVSEIRPKAPLNKHPSFVFEKKQKDKRLIIGNLKVEVVTPRPLKASQAPVQKIQRIIKTQPRQERSPGGFKLRFGLGQV